MPDVHRHQRVSSSSIALQSSEERDRKHPRKRKFMQAFAPEWRPLHIHQDVFERLSKKYKVLVDQMVPDDEASCVGTKAANIEICIMLRRSYKKCGGSFGTSWCDVHGRDCTVDDLHSMDGSDNAQLLDVEKDMAGEKVYEPVLRLVTAGVPCIGNSAMNNNAAGDGDACMRPTGMMLAERDFMKEELIVIECTNQWGFG